MERIRILLRLRAGEAISYHKGFSYKRLIVIFAVSILIVSPVFAQRAVDVLILGGGPAGLYAAKVAAKEGKTVLVIEQRHLEIDPNKFSKPANIFNSQEDTIYRGNPWGSRTRTITLPSPTVQSLHNFQIEAGLTKVEEMVLTYGKTGTNTKKSNIEFTDTFNTLSRGLLKKDFEALVPIGALEVSLLESVVNDGSQIMFSTQLDTVNPSENAATLKTSNGTNLAVNFDKLVVAEGDNSHTLKKLGVPMNSTNIPNSNWYGIELPGEHVPKGKIHMQKTTGLPEALAMSNNGYTTVLIETSDPSQSSLDTFKKILSNYGYSQEVDSNKVFHFRSNPKVASQFMVGENIFIIGNAARSIHPITGSGVSLAIRDGNSFHSYLKGEKKGLKRARLKQKFIRDMKNSAKYGRVLSQRFLTLRKIFDNEIGQKIGVTGMKVTQAITGKEGPAENCLDVLRLLFGGASSKNHP